MNRDHSSEVYAAALTLADERGRVKPGDIVRSTGLSGVTVWAMLGRLVAAGLIRTNGRKRSARRYWVQRRAVLRPCLCCGHNFPSEGAHNRICPDCKSADVWRHAPSLVMHV